MLKPFAHPATCSLDVFLLRWNITLWCHSDQGVWQALDSGQPVVWPLKYSSPSCQCSCWQLLNVEASSTVDHSDLPLSLSIVTDLPTFRNSAVHSTSSISYFLVIKHRSAAVMVFLIKMPHFFYSNPLSVILHCLSSAIFSVL